MDLLGNVQDTRDPRGNQTLVRLVNSLKASNVNPTHFLLIFFQFNRKTIRTSDQHSIRKMLFNYLNNKKYTININNNEDDQIFIKWKSQNEKSSIIYWSISRFEETYIRQLTKGLIQASYNSILSEFGITRNDLSLSYLTTKNMEFKFDLETGEQQFIGDAFPQTPVVDFPTQVFNQAREIENDNQPSGSESEQQNFQEETENEKEGNQNEEEENDNEEEENQNENDETETEGDRSQDKDEEQMVGHFALEKAIVVEPKKIKGVIN